MTSDVTPRATESVVRIYNRESSMQGKYAYLMLEAYCFCLDRILSCLGFSMFTALLEQAD